MMWIGLLGSRYTTCKTCQEIGSTIGMWSAMGMGPTMGMASTMGTESAMGMGFTPWV